MGMKELNTQTIIDYTAVPAGWLIKGHLWTGQPTVSTITCPKCGRVGVICSQRKGRQIIVHSGRVENERLTGIDYCEIAVNPKTQIKKTLR
jgi:hypothetical protein